MEILGLPHWTLTARLEDDALEFVLGDGRRLAWRARRPADVLPQARQPLAAHLLLGAELAERLARSEPRVLNLQLDAALDGVAWESLGLGTGTLAGHFALARQPASDGEPVALPPATLAETLAVAAVHAGTARACPPARHVALDALGQRLADQILAASHVIVLDGVDLGQLRARAHLPARERVLVATGPQAPALLVAALDDGAAVLALEREDDLLGEPLDALLARLGGGESIGEAVRWLHRRAAPAPFAARLYGDPAMRFVRVQEPTSRRQVTSLSFDLVGSTTLLRERGDEAYAEILARLHALCTDVVRRQGGKPDDPQGDDGVMCYFGHPMAIEHAAVRAVRAGLELARTVADLGVAVRVGIATGLVAIKNGQPVGLSIHLAARLQQVVAPGGVLVSESTRRLVAQAFELEALRERPAMKGIDGADDVYLVAGPRRMAPSRRVDVRPVPTPIVGRQAEIASLLACMDQTRVGECRVAVVRGEAGIGKSRLVREFRHRLASAGVQVLECRCRADASASPYLALVEALRRGIGIDPDDSDEEATRKLAQAMPASAREGASFALLSGLMGLAPPPQLSSTVLRQRLLRLLLDWFGAFSADRPCCLIVEDWHWVDPSMREFVEHLVAQAGGPGLLVVITARAEVAHAPFEFERYASFDLAGLAPEAALELVGLTCADAPLPAGLVRMLAARGDGVPLFLEEATRIALEWRGEGTGMAALESVPASLQDLLMARLDRLGRAKPVAQVAAVLGREFSQELLAAVLESGSFALDAATLRERVAVLVDSGLVRAEGSQLAFKHALIRDAAYGSLWVRDRRALHARVVTLLQERWPELPAARPELLAQHQTEAGLYCEALAQWERAARSAASRSADLEAISHLRRALGVLAHIEPGVERDHTALRLQLMLAARLIPTEGYGAESVLQAYLEAQRLCDRSGDDATRFKVEMGLEAYRFMRADFGPALAHGRRAAAIATRSGDAKQRLHAHWGLACTLFHQGDLRATMREMEAGLALYTPPLQRQFGVQDPGVMCLSYSAWGLWERGQPDAALARVRQAVEIASAHAHKFSQAVALAHGASIALLRGDTDVALDRADACIAVCEEAGFPVWLAIARCMRGRLLCEQGRFEAGLGEMRAGLDAWRRTGSRVSQPFYLSLQAEGLMLAGQFDAAARCVDEGLAITERYGERQLEAELHRLRGALALQRGDLAEAERWLKTAYALAIRQQRLGFALRSATALARLWVADGREARARRLLVPLVARWTEGRGTRDLRAALALCDAWR